MAVVALVVIGEDVAALAHPVVASAATVVAVVASVAVAAAEVEALVHAVEVEVVAGEHPAAAVAVAGVVEGEFLALVHPGLCKAITGIQSLSPRALMNGCPTRVPILWTSFISYRGHSPVIVWTSSSCRLCVQYARWRQGGG